MDITFPDILIDPSLSLEDNYERAISEFEKSGYIIYRPDYLNSVILANDITKVFNVTQDDVKYSIFVINTTFDDMKTSKILNSFIQPDEKSKVYFYSAYPLPDILAYINTNNKTAYFELEIIRNTKNIMEIVTDPSLLPKYIDILNNLTVKYFDKTLNEEHIQSLKNLELIVTKEFRQIDDYETIYDTDIVYFPHYSMLLFGIYLTWLISNKMNGEIFINKDLIQTGVGFSSKKDDVINIMAHPIEKVFKFFFYGKDASVINWYYDLRYSLQELEKEHK